MNRYQLTVIVEPGDDEALLRALKARAGDETLPWVAALLGQLSESGYRGQLRVIHQSVVLLPDPPIEGVLWSDTDSIGATDDRP